MKAIIARIERFLVSNTVWIFLTALLFIDYLLILELPRSNWSNYISNFFGLIILFIPVLFYTTYRTRLRRRLSSNIFGFLWFFCFILYPLILARIIRFYLEKGVNFSGLSIGNDAVYELLITIGAILLLTEIAIQFNNNLLQWVQKIKWVQKIGLERSILSVLFFLSVLGAGAGVIELMSVAEKSGFALVIWFIIKFIFFTLQFMIIGLAYYFFYYANHYILIPKLLKQKGIIYYGFSVVALILVFYPIFLTLIHWLPGIKELKIDIFASDGQLFAKDGGGTVFLIMILSVPIIISNQWFKQAGEIANLAKEKSETELNLLKQQINPHFFFNTLNNLYALSLKNDAATPEVIMRLSELMRYVIYRGKEDTVSLAEEVKHIEDYICLQQLRLHKQLHLQFTKDIINEKLQIPPLLFIIMIENAFKHGIEPADKQCFLRIYIKSNDHNLIFTCENSVEEKNRKTPGIGLGNLQRRLELRFPNQHELKVEETDHTFKAKLNLVL